MKNKVIEAVGVVIINNDNKVLIAKRKDDKPMPNKWEFPGGKLEQNETLKECGIREIKEELELDISIDEYIGFEELSHNSKDFLLHMYTAYKLEEDQQLKLNEHTDFAWINLNQLCKYDFPAMDLSFIKKLNTILWSK